MIFLPRFTKIAVQGYKMYPGTTDSPGLQRDLLPGITLVVGANGLGKTTLVSIMRHLCAGPARIANRGGEAFGAGSLHTTKADLRTFAGRVGDDAVTAEASLDMKIGDTTVSITRSLKNLRIVQLAVDGESVSADETAFKKTVLLAAGLDDYADWILLMDHLVFVTEDRLQPFWDENVQRHLLRVLVNSDGAATALSEAEGVHLSADSEFRNARAQLTRHQKRYASDVEKAKKSGSGQDRIAELLNKLSDLSGAKDELQATVDQSEDTARASNRDSEMAESEFQLLGEKFETDRLEFIEASMPCQDDVLKYLWARHSTAPECPACGQAGSAKQAFATISECFVCGLKLEAPPSAVSREILTNSEERLASARSELSGQRDRASTDATAHAAEKEKLAALQLSISSTERELRALNKQLSGSPNNLVDTATLISDLEADLKDLRTALAGTRARLSALMASNNKAIAKQQGGIKRTFDVVASKFLVEECHLVPHETKVRIGQDGQQFEAQSFDLDLGSASKTGESRRTARHQVSESQRIYIDIAFRISLIRACAGDSQASIVIDAPEGSLDVVFSRNAARLLSELLQTPSGLDNRLVVATNLVEGSLLPALAEAAEITDPASPRVIDLLEIAAPTAALLAHGSDYRAFRDKALSSKQQ